MFSYEIAPDVKMMMFIDITKAPANTIDANAVASFELELLFSSRGVTLLSTVLSVVIRLRELMALLKQYAHTREGKAAYLRVLHKLDTTHNGATGTSVVLQDLTTHWWETLI